MMVHAFLSVGCMMSMMVNYDPAAIQTHLYREYQVVPIHTHLTTTQPPTWTTAADPVIVDALPDADNFDPAANTVYIHSMFAGQDYQEHGLVDKHG